MTDFYRDGECIEGAKVRIITKKYIRQGIVFSPTGFTGIKYKCSRDGSAEILESLSSDEIDLSSNINKDIHFNVGDRIRSSSFYFIAESIRSIDCFNVTMMSGRHECSEGTFNVRVFAEIQIPFSHISNAIDKSQKEEIRNKEKLRKIFQKNKERTKNC